LLFVVGCAHEVEHDEVQLGRLSMDQRRYVFASERDVSVAEVNLDAARRARDHADTFGRISDEELAAAEDHAWAASDALKRARRGDVPAAVDAALRSLDVADRQVVAARAKRDLARKLGDVRRAEVGLAADQLEAYRRDLRVVRADTLRRNGIQPAEDLSALVRARNGQRWRVALDQRKVARLRDEADQLRVAWDGRRRDYDVAAREGGRTM
jgi:hypothetical protein